MVSHSLSLLLSQYFVEKSLCSHSTSAQYKPTDISPKDTHQLLNLASQPRLACLREESEGNDLEFWLQNFRAPGHCAQTGPPAAPRNSPGLRRCGAHSAATKPAPGGLECPPQWHEGHSLLAPTPSRCLPLLQTVVFKFTSCLQPYMSILFYHSMYHVGGCKKHRLRVTARARIDNSS